jgi:hypothetical protein
MYLVGSSCGRLAGDDLASNHHRRYPSRVADVCKGVRIQQDEICELASFDCPERGQFAQEFRGVSGRRRQGLHGGQPGIDEIRQLIMNRAIDGVGREIRPGW